MIGDPQRLQYLEAMGIASWASRYRFVNARPTGQVEWEVAPEPEKPARGQRLQALLETPARPVERDRPATDEAPTPQTAAPLSRARALLGGDAARGESPRPSPHQAADPDAAAVSPSSEDTGAEQAPANATREAAAAVDPLRFTLSLSVIGERWWLMLPGERPISAAGQALLGQMLKSVGMPAGGAPLSSLTWPLMDMPASDPVGEAREGIQVFCAGQARRHGMKIDGAVIVGDEVWSSLLDDPANELEWTCHHLPHPDDMLDSASAKRACWPLLQTAGSAWRQGLDAPE